MKVSEEILNLIPYKPGKPISETQREYGIQHIIKLASNENPLGPSPKAVAAIQKHLSELHRYPDPSCHDLVQKISRLWKIDAKKISIGNGSNELIDLLIRIFCEPGEAILTSQSAFVAYQVCAQASRVKRFFAPLLPGYRPDLQKMADFLLNEKSASGVRLVFLPNPNNPTGTYSPIKEVEAFLAKISSLQDVMVVFDEAYNEFVRASDYRSAQTLMEQYGNIAVVRTLSKAYGLAGLRIGVLLASPEVIELINRVRNPFNVNDMAQVAAVAALDDVEFIESSKKTTWEGLDYFYRELTRLGLPYIESQGNFVMFDTGRDVKQVHVSLLKRGIILRPIDNYGFPTEMRMSVGLPEENRAAIVALEAVLAEIPPLKV
jgi:histidinol-phosphate aminotransferase